MERIHIENYPSIKAHLDHFWDRISIRADKGDTPYNLRNCAYMDDFFKPKLVYMEIQTDNPREGYLFPCFSYDEDGKIVLNTGYIMNSKKYDIRYILGILNSIVGRQIARLYVTQLQERQFRMLSQYVNLFPIPLPIKPFYTEIISLTQRLLNNEEKGIEADLNKIVAMLYKLDDVEYDYLLGLNT